MMKREYLHELHPEDHGFRKEDYDKKIFLGSYLDTGYASINEILFFKQCCIFLVIAHETDLGTILALLGVAFRPWTRSGRYRSPTWPQLGSSLELRWAIALPYLGVVVVAS